MNKRIHIIGGSGSGKSYIAQKLSTRLNIPVYDLDDIFWDNIASSFGKKANPKTRNAKLQEILAKETWIIEGVYYDWLWQSFKAADLIFILKPSIYLQHKRVIIRFLKRKIGFEKCKKKETLHGLFNLIRWNHNYNQFVISKIIDSLGTFKQKVIIVKDNKEILTYMITH